MESTKQEFSDFRDYGHDGKHHSATVDVKITTSEFRWLVFEKKTTTVHKDVKIFCEGRRDMHPLAMMWRFVHTGRKIEFRPSRDIGDPVDLYAAYQFQKINK